MSELKAIAATILAVMKDVGYVQKQGRNTAQNYNYGAEADTVAKVRQAMIDHGLIAMPTVIKYDVIPAGETKQGATKFLTTILVEYRFIDVATGEELTGSVVGQGVDSGDKGPYKAATGANKYMLWKALQIATGDDPERDDKAERAVKEAEELAECNAVIERIEKGESEVYPVEKAVEAARVKYLGEQFKKKITPEAGLEKLRAYGQHIIKKYRALQSDGDGRESQEEEQDESAGAIGDKIGEIRDWEAKRGLKGDELQNHRINFLGAVDFRDIPPEKLTQYLDMLKRDSDWRTE